MALREQDKHFLSSLYSAVSIIFIWKGLWEGIYEIPVVSKYIGDPFVFLFLGLTMLTLSGVIFKEFDPLGGVDKAINKILHFVHNHPHKKDFSILYYDRGKKKELLIPAGQLKSIEKGTLVVQHTHRREEVFIPAHRIREVLYKGKPYWRL